MTTTQIDTIYALATLAGRSGVAVVRVSGARALDGLKDLCTGLTNPQPRMANLCHLIDPVSRETIDKALAIYFKNPASFTGEDVVEYHLHGGLAVIQSLLSALSAMDGYRMAEPGEFTKRAFENEKLDLTEAEAVADLIDAQTRAQKNQALEQLDGALSKIYDNWRETLTRSLAYLEADIDFPDEDLPDGVAVQVRPQLEAIDSELQEHLQDNRRGERLRDGIQVAVIGAPNAGKSSIVNVLAQRDVAIVSDIAGTTRDVIEVHLDLGGFPVILADTAGLRPDQLGDSAHDSIESEGIRRALERAEKADLRMLVFDGSLAELDQHTKALIDENSIIVINKSDLLQSSGEQIESHQLINISAQSGAGINALLEQLTEKISGMMGTSDVPSLTRQRHREALLDCQNSLQRAMAAPMPELMAEDVRLAVRHLGRITGRVDVEDLLDVIFKDFCIGK